tara:strand:- start:1192 stop:1374 length:183 start_codon:yes stop_codon:yes gene_type:complete
LLQSNPFLLLCPAPFKELKSSIHHEPFGERFQTNIGDALTIFSDPVETDRSWQQGLYLGV